MRAERDTDFFVTLPEVGTFRYGRRTFGDRLSIRRVYLRLVEEFGDSDVDLSVYAGIIATHEILCVSAPAGWENLLELDITDGSMIDKCLHLIELLREQEASLKKGGEKSGEGSGEGDGVDGGVSVPPEIPPSAE